MQNTEENKFVPAPERPFQQPIVVTKRGPKAFFQRVKSHLFQKPTRKHLVAVSGISLAILALGVGGLALFGPEAPAPNPEPVVTSNYVPPEPQKFFSPLTGLETTEAKAARPITAVMIENSVDARPQSGLEEAGIVFEAIAEGGITRFMAVYQEAEPGYIGPIRSARPYYVRWAAGYDAGYVHSGGSGEALALIGSLGIKDMDHGTYGNKFFDRVSNRFAPHNVYTSMARLDQLRAERGYDKSTFTQFSRVTEETPNTLVGSPARTVTFDISSPLYDTSYTYDVEKKLYTRIMAGAPHIDEKSGRQISPKAVVALYMSYGIHPDGLHSVYGNVGSGKALIAQNGTAYEAQWSKPSDTASLEVKNPDGSNFLFEPGQVWITAIPEGKVTFSP